MAKFFLFPALIKSVQNCPIASEPLIGCTPGGIKTASLVYSAGNAFPFKLLYAADHSLFAASIAALILSWAHAIGAVNSTTKMAEEPAPTYPVASAFRAGSVVKVARSKWCGQQRTGEAANLRPIICLWMEPSESPALPNHAASSANVSVKPAGP